MRRSIAAAAGLLLLVLLVVGVRGCLNARKDRAVKDYVNDAGALTRESDQQGRSLFRLLSGAGGRDRPVDVENTLNGFRVQSEQLVDRGRGLDHPGDVDDAQRHLVQVLELRRDGIAGVADALPTALGDENRRAGARRVTQQMQAFLASDVLYSRRYAPSVRGVLQDRDLQDEARIPRSQFLPNIQWLQPSFVSQRIARLRSGTGGQGDEAATPGLHGNGLVGTSLGGQALTPGGTTTIALSGDLSASVQVANQGENTETDVPVRVSVGSGGDRIEADATIDSIAAGETKTVEVPIDGEPPTGQTVPVEVQVEAVPGEEKTDNNKQSFSAIFTK